MLKKILSFLLLFNMLTALVYAENNEKVFNVLYSGFSTVGVWQNTSLIGYDGEYILNANAETGAAAMWNVAVDDGQYRLFVWRCLKDSGCNSAKLSVTANGVTTDKEYSMAFGVTGWTDMGVYSLLDGKANIKISGETGTLMVSAIKLLKVNDNPVLHEINELYNNPFVLKNENSISYFGNMSYNIIEPKLYDGDIYIPLRFISEQIGYGVEWIGEENKVILTKNDKNIEFISEKDYIMINNEKIVLHKNTAIINNTFMVSVEDMRVFGYNSYVNEDGIVLLSVEAVSDGMQADALLRKLYID